MEVILYIIGLYGGFFLIGWLFSQISSAIKKHKEKIRNEVANEVLKDINIEDIIKNYKRKLEYLRYIKRRETENTIELPREQIFGGRNTQIRNMRKNIREKYKSSVNEQIIGKIRKIYS